MSSSRLWFAFIAGAVACFLLAGPFWVVPTVRDSLVMGGVLLTIGGVVHGYKGRRDRYDLRSLQEIHEREELRNLDVPAASDVDQVQCMCCQQVYAAKFPACPYCSERGRR